MHRIAASFLVAFLLASGPAARAEPEADWPQWRGPTRDGFVRGGGDWPATLTKDSPRLSWRAGDLGPSYSGPIIVGDRVFTTSTVEHRDEVVRCLDRKTGKEIWKTSWPGVMRVPFFAARNGNWIRATPALADDTLLVAGMRDVLVCLDPATGKERWRLDCVEQFKSPLPAFGFVSSPLVVGDAVFVQAGGGCLRVERRTGKVVWRALDDGGGMYGSAFSSPVLTRLAGAEQLVVQTRQKLAGLDPMSGKVLWSQPIEAFRGMNILTPTILGDTLFTSAYGGKSLQFTLRREDDAFRLANDWTLKQEGYMSSPVVIAGHAYLHLRNQRFCCIDLKQGKVMWTTEKRLGEYLSLVARGDRILALDQGGNLSLIRATPEKFDLLGTAKVGQGETWAHLAVVGNELFVRDMTGLSAYAW